MAGRGPKHSFGQLLLYHTWSLGKSKDQHRVHLLLASVTEASRSPVLTPPGRVAGWAAAQHLEWVPLLSHGRRYYKEGETLHRRYLCPVEKRYGLGALWSGEQERWGAQRLGSVGLGLELAHVCRTEVSAR